MLYSTAAPSLPRGLVNLPAYAHGYTVLRVVARHASWPDSAVAVPLSFATVAPQMVTVDFSSLPTGEWNTTVQLQSDGKPLLRQEFIVAHVACSPCCRSECYEQPLAFPYKQEFCHSHHCGCGEQHAAQHAHP